MIDKQKAERLCVVLWLEQRGSFFDGTDRINIRIERINEDDDDKTYAFKSCNDHGPVVYRDVGTLAYFKQGSRPFGWGELESWNVYSASVRDMKARIAAIEKTHKALEKIRESAGHSDKFEDYVVRLATALKSDAIFVSNEILLLAHKRRNIESLVHDRKGYARYTRTEAQYQLRSIASSLSETESDAAQ